MRRLRVADDEPVAIEEAVFPAAIAPLIQRADLEHALAARHARRGRPRPDHGPRPARRRAAGPEDALLLDVPEGSPLLVEKRVIHDQDGNPLELCESRYAGERYGLDVQFDVELSANPVGGAGAANGGSGSNPQATGSARGRSSERLTSAPADGTNTPRCHTVDRGRRALDRAAPRA